MLNPNTMASQLAAQIQRLQASSPPFAEVRLHITHEINEPPHEATLFLYCDKYDGTMGNIFYGDSPDAEVDLALSSYQGENKKFIATLAEQLPLYWGYLSVQVHLPFDREGFKDVSDRFDFQDLLAALATLASMPDSNFKSSTQPQAQPLIEREATLKAALQKHYQSLCPGDETTIYFACDIDEDLSSADDEVYVYKEHRVLDAGFQPIVWIDEDVFNANAPDNNIGDIETNIFEAEIDEFLIKNGTPAK